MLESGRLEHVLSFASNQEHVHVAIAGPRRPNQGVIEPDEDGKVGMRLAEKILADQDLSPYYTPGEVMACKRWMRKGFALYNQFDKLGYSPYPHLENPRQYLEAIPEVSFCLWLERHLLPSRSLEGRLQRQLVLYDHGLDIQDPIRFFEEVTRHRLLQGLLPYDMLYSPVALNALANAYTAWLAVADGGVTLVGDASEGQICLPIENY
jgi:hypothetical protein